MRSVHADRAPDGRQRDRRLAGRLAPGQGRPARSSSATAAPTRRPTRARGARTPAASAWCCSTTAPAGRPTSTPSPPCTSTAADGAPIKAYARRRARRAAGTIGLGSPPASHRMSSFSSRGPGLADPNVMKPDLTAPGSTYRRRVRAALHPRPARRGGRRHADAAAGVGPSQGTSMATPHVAGPRAAAQAVHPTWSPAAIKSALMTSTTPVKLSNGNARPDPLEHRRRPSEPQRRRDPEPGLRHPDQPTTGASSAAWTRPRRPAWELPDLGRDQAVEPEPAVAAGSRRRRHAHPDAQGDERQRRDAHLCRPSTLPGWASLSPASLTLAPGASASFTVKLTAHVGDSAPGPSAAWPGATTCLRPQPAECTGAGHFATPAQVNKDKRSTGKGSTVFAVQVQPTPAR